MEEGSISHFWGNNLQLSCKEGGDGGGQVVIIMREDEGKIPTMGVRLTEENCKFDPSP